MRHKVAIRFAIEGDLRFISHHDVMRLFERALGRAQLPVRFSEGFNPRPKLSLPLPRAVGVASEAELLVVTLDEPIEPAEVLARLTAQMPGGLTLMEAWALTGSAMLHPHAVVYAVPVPADLQGQVAAAVDRLMRAEAWPLARVSPDGRDTRQVDVRAFLTEMVVEGSTLRWTCRIGREGTLRPVEVLAAAGLAREEHAHRVRRLQVDWRLEAPQDLPSNSD